MSFESAILEHRSRITLFLPQYRTYVGVRILGGLFSLMSARPPTGLAPPVCQRSMALAKVGMPSNCEATWASQLQAKTGLVMIRKENGNFLFNFFAVAFTCF